MNARELQKAMMQDLEDLFRKDQLMIPSHTSSSGWTAAALRKRLIPTG